MTKGYRINEIEIKIVDSLNVAEVNLNICKEIIGFLENKVQTANNM